MNEQELFNKLQELQNQVDDLRVILFKKTGGGPSDIRVEKLLVNTIDRASGAANWVTIDDDLTVEGDVNLGSEDAKISFTAADIVNINGVALFGGGDKIEPPDNNTVTLGTASKKWSDVRSVLINGLDYCFDNGFTLTEHDRVYIKEPGIAILDKQNNLIAFIGKKGIYTKNVLDIKDIDWKKTTQKERIAMK